MLGRKPDLTDRTQVWKMLLEIAQNPLIGAGYESFWSGERLLQVWERMGVNSGGIIQAHNGYIEIYLSLGLVGFVLLIGSIISGFLKVRKELDTLYAQAILKMTFIFVVAISNYTEASFKPVSNYFVLLMVSILEVGKPNKPARNMQPNRNRLAVGIKN